MWRDSESEQDFLNFSEVADQIAALVLNPALLPISVGLFGGWGTGKSTVLRLVEAKLPKAGKGIPIVVNFDAWLYQGFDDARAALMEVVSQRVLTLAKEKETLIEKAQTFAGRINYFRAIGLAADFGLGMALGIPPGLLTRAGTALTSIVSGDGSAADKVALEKAAKEGKAVLSELIRPAEKRTPPQEIEAFRREFGELLEGLETTLVLFIDNLDRCLPDAAIGTLEAVRLFLFMPRTAFVIAADEGMIRHSVAKHFNDPQASHVRDYLDKVIQVPLRVPQVGAQDLRAYMYSLFVGLMSPDALPKVQGHLMKALQNAWKGETFNRDEVLKLAGGHKELPDSLAVADRLAPILATAPNVQGNPRIVKRLLNAILLRSHVAAIREMKVDLATLAKIAVFERCTDEKATLELYRIITEKEQTEGYLLPADKQKKEAPELPEPWKSHAEFISQWQAMEPLFDGKVDLRAAVFLSRDVMAPAQARGGISESVREAVAAFLKVTGINSPVGKEIAAKLSLPERRAAMSLLIDTMRPGDWSSVVPGIHGAILLAKQSQEATADLKAFVATLPKARLEKGIAYLLKQENFLDGK